MPNSEYHSPPSRQGCGLGTPQGAIVGQRRFLGRRVSAHRVPGSLGTARLTGGEVGRCACVEPARLCLLFAGTLHRRLRAELRRFLGLLAQRLAFARAFLGVLSLSWADGGYDAFTGSSGARHGQFSRDAQADLGGHQSLATPPQIGVERLRRAGHAVPFADLAASVGVPCGCNVKLRTHLCQPFRGMSAARRIRTACRLWREGSQAGSERKV